MVPVDPLSPRALIAGMGVGIVVSAMNVSFGLKAGWAQGGSVISAVVSIALFKALRPKVPFTPLEANVCQCTASAAGSMTMAAGLIGPIPALQMLGIKHNMLTMALWGMAVAYLGVFFAVPLRTHFVVDNASTLKFPSGTATAETIKSMFADAGKATEQVTTLTRFAIVASVITVVTWLIPPLLKPPIFQLLGLGYLVKLGFGFRVDPILVGGGALMGTKTGISVLLGSTIAYGLIAPVMHSNGLINGNPLDMKHGARGLMLWPGVAAMATDAIAQLVSAAVENAIHKRRGLRKGNIAQKANVLNIELQLPLLKIKKSGRMDMAPVSVAGAVDTEQKLTGIARIDFQRANEAREAAERKGAHLFEDKDTQLSDESELSAALKSDDPRHEIPNRWWVLGLLFAAVICVVTLSGPFGMKPWQPLLAIPVAAALSYVAVRCAGETDINPVGPMGKIVQLVFAVVAPGETVANLMAAAVSCGAAGQAGDLMQDFKAGRLMGLSPKKQLLAQMAGIPAGLLGAVPTFALLRDAHPLGGEQFPAPAATAWMAVAQALTGGGGVNGESKGLPNEARVLMAFAASLTIIFRIAEVMGRLYLSGAGKVVPYLSTQSAPATRGAKRKAAARFIAKTTQWLPSPTSCGIGCIIPPEFSVAIAVGAGASGWWQRTDPKQHEQHAHIAASGLLAGAGVTGVLTAVAGLATGNGGG
tara:strand:+ start:242 stop:2347 length:2106 start_codon:yes stop_codon:yes gene_type:complete